MIDLMPVGIAVVMLPIAAAVIRPDIARRIGRVYRDDVRRVGRAVHGLFEPEPRYQEIERGWSVVDDQRRRKTYERQLEEKRLDLLVGEHYETVHVERWEQLAAPEGLASTEPMP